MTIKNKFLIILLFFSIGLNAQSWKANLNEKSNPTFFDIQNAFYSHFEKNAGQINQKGSGYKQFKRWEWFWETRINEDGTFPKNTSTTDEWKKWNKKNSKQLGSYEKSASNWTFLGPSTSGGGYEGIGRVNCIAFHPTDINTFWIGTPAGGLWKTTNFGASWTTNTDNLPVLGVSDIAIDYTNPNIMYIATGDGDRGSIYGDTKSMGILKSIDGGVTWTTVLSATPDQEILIRRLLIHPTNPQILITVTSSGIFKTVDGGTNWNVPQLGYFIDLEFKPGEPSTVYATTFDNSGSGDAQIFRSTDTGDTWTKVSSFSGINRINIAVSAASPTLVDALCSRSDNEGLAGLWYSNDSGASFTQYWDPTNGNFLGWEGDASDEGGQGSYDLAYALDPTNANNIYLGGINTWKSNDAGTSWSMSNMWTNSGYNYPPGTAVVHADKHFLKFHPLNSDYLFECNDGGVYYSDDDGVTWNDISNGLQISQFYKFSNSAVDPNLIVGGCQDNSTKIKDGSTWSMLYPNGDGMECIIDHNDANIYVSGPNGKISRLEDGAGASDISANIPGTPSGSWVTPYAIHPTNSQILYAGYDKVYKTTDRGATWTAISTDLNGGDPLNYLVVSPTNPDFIYVATLDNIYKTTNGGGSWVDITPPHTANISSLTIDPSDENVLLITFSGYIDGEKVYQTLNAGGSWGNASINLPNLPANCIVIDKNTETLYLGTDVGIYVYANGFTDWQLYNINLPNVVITELEIQYNTSKIRAATFGRGIWESDIFLYSYSISASVNPTNSGTISGTGIYNQLETVNLTATHKTGYGFVNWTEGGTEVSTDAIYSFTATEDRILIANFEVVPTFDISANVNPVNSGTISGDKTYNQDETANLIASPKVGYGFVNWTESGTEVSTNTNYSFTVTENKTLTANFEVLPTFDISANVNPANSGTISGTETYYQGETAKLIATTKTGYNFVNWTESGTEVSTNTNYSFTVTENKTLTANFELQATFNISANINPANSGTISGAETYNQGETANLIATPQTGYNFVNWTEGGAQVSTNANYSFAVTENRTLIANFEIQTFDISASSNPSSSGTIDGTGNFDYEQTANLTATPQTGYNFINWTENGTQVSTNTNYSFTVTKKRTLIANFEIQTFDISATVSPANSGTISGIGNFDYGQIVNLTAIEQTGYDFTNWTENGTEVSTNADYSFTVTEKRILIANLIPTTGISEIENTDIFTLYPNPTNGLLNIQSKIISENNNQKITIKLINFLGEKQELKIINNNTEIIQVDVSNRNNGIYFMQIMIDNELNKTLKVIIAD